MLIGEGPRTGVSGAFGEQQMNGAPTPPTGRMTWVEMPEPAVANQSRKRTITP